MVSFRRIRAGLEGVALVIRRVTASKRFFHVVVIIFSLQALWIAISGRYSMAYDEYFHLGIIQAYAHQWLPSLRDVPSQTAQFGAVSRDPSFLYHYLMSFPYRLFAHYVHSFAAQVIFLRLWSLGFFVAGLFVYRRLLLRVGLGARLTHLVLLFFSLIPTFVMLAAQINYDNAAFLLTGLVLLGTVKLHDDLVAGTLSVHDALGLAVVLLIASMTKYPLLPIVATVTLFILFYVWYYRKNIRWKQSFDVFFRRAHAGGKLLLIVVFFILSILFISRIGVNVVRYHTPAPSCDQVLNDQLCRAYDPYRRNAQFEDEGLEDELTRRQIKDYPHQWYDQMIQEAFFAVGPRELDYAPQPALASGLFAAKIITGMMIFVIFFHLLWLWRRSPYFKLFLLVCVGYLAALYWQNYHDFRMTGVMVAVHARYVVFLMPLLGAMTGVSLRRSLPRSWRLPIGMVFGVLLVFLVAGGGWLPFILRSWDAWIWPPMIDANRALRSFFWWFIPRG